MRYSRGNNCLATNDDNIWTGGPRAIKAPRGFCSDTGARDYECLFLPDAGTRRRPDQEKKKKGVSDSNAVPVEVFDCNTVMLCRKCWWYLAP